MKKIIALLLSAFIGISSFGQNTFKNELRAPSIRIGTPTSVKIDSITAIGNVLKFYNGVTELLANGAGGSMIFPSAGIALSTGAGWGVPIVNNSANWNTAYSERLQWDGGGTALNAANGRLSLGGTAVGQNLFTLTNPFAVSFIRINSDNSISMLSESNLKLALNITASDVGLANVTNESKSTMFTNPTFTGTAVKSNSDTLATRAYARTYGGIGVVTIEDVRNSTADSLNVLRPRFVAWADTAKVLTKYALKSELSSGGSMTYPTAGIALSTGSTWSGSITNNSTNWNTAYSERRQWDGSTTNLVASTGRTSLGGTTVGQNLFTLANPGAVTFLRINTDNTISTIGAATFKSDLTLVKSDVGLSNVTNESKATMFTSPTFTGILPKYSTTDTLSTMAYARTMKSSTAGTVTSVAMTVPTGLSISGTPITGSGTLALSLASGYSLLHISEGTELSSVAVMKDDSTANKGYAPLYGTTVALAAKEASLGNPGTTGYVLSSTTAGSRSWVAQSGGLTEAAVRAIIKDTLTTILAAAPVGLLREDSTATKTGNYVTSKMLRDSITANLGGGGSMTWPATAGIPVYDGSSAWGTSLNSTVIGEAMLNMTSPSAVRFVRTNADNSVTARSAAELKQDLGLENVTNISEATAIANLRKVDSDTIPLFVFGAGGGLSGDTALFNNGVIAGVFYNAGSDTLIVTQLMGILGTGTGNPTISAQIYWDATFMSESATVLNTTPAIFASTTTGTSDISFNNNNIPPKAFVWCVLSGASKDNKPRIFSLTMAGIKRNRRY